MELTCAWEAPVPWPSRADPYYGWMLNLGLRQPPPASLAQAPRGRVSVIVELHPGQSPADLSKFLDVPPVYLQPLPGAHHHDGPGPSRFITGDVDEAHLPDLMGLVAAVELSRHRPPAQAAGPAVRDAAPPRQADIVIGVIDDGCAFLRSEFTDSHGRTRIRALWDQDARHADAPWSVPAGFGYGRMLTHAAIDTLRERTDGETDAQVYQRLQHVVRFPSDRIAATHGTAVLGLAAATHDPAVPAQADSHADIVFVHLPEQVTRDTSGGGLPVHVLDGMRFILAQAGAGVPVVINVSYGGLAGPHDGSSIVERAIAELIERRPGTAVVVSAGNGAGKRCQAHGRLADGGTTSLVWNINSSDATDSFCEVWLRGAAPAHAVAVTLDPPPGFLDVGPCPPVRCGQQASLVRRDADGNVVAVLASVFNAGPVPNGKDPMILLAVAPARTGDTASNAPFGRWRIGLQSGAGGPALEFDAFIERDDPTPQPSLGGVQSQFDDPIVPGPSLSSLAGGPWTVAVGALREVPSPQGPRVEIPAYCGRGAGGKDLTAVALAERGLAQCIGSTPFLGPGQAAINRTSAAAPIVTRWLAGQILSWQAGKKELPDAAAILGMFSGDLRGMHSVQGIPRVP